MDEKTVNPTTLNPQAQQWIAQTPEMAAALNEIFALIQRGEISLSEAEGKLQELVQSIGRASLEQWAQGLEPQAVEDAREDGRRRVDRKKN